jgi:hypothetical protein
MKIQKLTPLEKEKIKLITGNTFEETINNKKNFINKIVVDWVFKNGIKNTWFAFPTQYGNIVIKIL